MITLLIVGYIDTVRARKKNRELKSKIETIRIGDTSCEVIMKMRSFPDEIYIQDSLDCTRMFYYNVKTFRYDTPFGSSSDIFFSFQQNSDTLLEFTDIW